MRLLLLLTSLLFATPVWSQVRDYWGVYGDLTELKLERSETHFANLYFRNALSPSPDFHTVELSIDGVAVLIKLTHGKGELPDTITVIVPDGFIASPTSIIVDENTTVKIEIHEILIG